MAERRRPEPETGTGTGTTVRSADWHGRDLAGERHERVEFVEVDLTEAASRGAAFTDCAFTRCACFDATFTGCKLVWYAERLLEPAAGRFPVSARPTGVGRAGAAAHRGARRDLRSRSGR